MTKYILDTNIKKLRTSLEAFQRILEERRAYLDSFEPRTERDFKRQKAMEGDYDRMVEVLIDSHNVVRSMNLYQSFMDSMINDAEAFHLENGLNLMLNLGHKEWKKGSKEIKAFVKYRDRIKHYEPR